MSNRADCRVPDFLSDAGLRALFAELTDRRCGTKKLDDYDLYLVQNDVWPVLLEGLDELGRKLAFRSDCGDTQDWNPIKWLGQYLARNHPRNASRAFRDPVRQNCLATLRRCAELERSRRAFLRRKHLLEELFHKFAKQEVGRDPMAPASLLFSKTNPVLLESDVARFLEFVDQEWFLEGQLQSHFHEISGPTLRASSSTSPPPGTAVLHPEESARTSAEPGSSASGVQVDQRGNILDQQDEGQLFQKMMTFSDVWALLRRTIETDRGALDVEVLKKADQRKREHAERQKRTSTLKKLEARILDLRARWGRLETRFATVVRKLKVDMAEVLDFEFVFPRTVSSEDDPMICGLRALLQLWYDGIHRENDNYDDLLGAFSGEEENEKVQLQKEPTPAEGKGLGADARGSSASAASSDRDGAVFLSPREKKQGVVGQEEVSTTTKNTINIVVAGPSSGETASAIGSTAGTAPTLLTPGGPSSSLLASKTRNNPGAQSPSMIHNLQAGLHTSPTAPPSSVVAPGCPWATIVKFFRSLKTQPGETDFEGVQRLFKWSYFLEVAGKGPLHIVDVEASRTELLATTTRSGAVSASSLAAADVDENQQPPALVSLNIPPPLLLRIQGHGGSAVKFAQLCGEDWNVLHAYLTDALLDSKNITLTVSLVATPNMSEGEAAMEIGAVRLVDGLELVDCEPPLEE
ncbi:unnamed protein product [Amoebophrya sp. A120]|nr:unnamed protein product [Amoebophrya sp. A120]|eukprot:GSA120T00018455001.1